MADLRTLANLRDEIVKHETLLRRLREKRDKLAVRLATRGFPERTVGEHAGIAGSYVNALKRKASEKEARAAMIIEGRRQ